MMNGNENASFFGETSGSNWGEFCDLMGKVRLDGAHCDLQQRFLVVFTELGHGGVVASSRE